MSESYDEVLKHYKKAISSCNKFKCKGKTMPYTSANGYMFSFLDKDGHVNVRLDKDDLKKFIKDNDTKGTEQYGHKMKEFAVVPEEIVRNSKKLGSLLRKSYKYVDGLKPKPAR